MPLIVQKFGGTSVANIECIKTVARKVKKAKEAGFDVVVVASAMAGVTDHLVNLSSQTSMLKSKAQMQEFDAIVATGEVVTCGLISLALMELGVKAHSWQGWQVPILCDDAFTKGRILKIDTKLIKEALLRDEVPIITGFQGICGDRIITLGRGGSDTSAAALAHALDADFCDIYTDVEGVFTADPNVVPSAKKLEKVSFSHMLELASSGAKVLHPRAIEIAQKNNLTLRVLSTFNDGSGSMIVSEIPAIEQHQITGVASDSKVCLIKISNLDNIGEVLSNVNDKFRQASVNPIQFSCVEHELSFLLQAIDLNNAITVLEDMKIEHNVHVGISLVAVVGIGIKNNPNLLIKALEIIHEEQSNILQIFHSEIKISFVIKTNNVHNIVNRLHDCIC